MSGSNINQKLLFGLFILLSVASSSYLISNSVSFINRGDARSLKPGNFLQSVPIIACESHANKISLSWTKSINAAGYRVQQKNYAGTNWQSYAWLPAEQREYVLYSSESSGAISIRIIAANRNFTVYSNTVTVNLLNCSGRALNESPAASADNDTVPLPPESGATQSAPKPAVVKWGAYAGWRDSDLADFERKIGQPVNQQAVFVHWGNENKFPSNIALNLKIQGKTLIIFWEAMDYNIDSPYQPRFNYDSIIAGNWDDYIASFAQSVKLYGGPVIIVLFEEANGDWYPWSITQNNNSPAKHIAAYRRIHNMFAGATNVKFGWSVNDDSVPNTAENQIEKFYPGDAYVDYVGVNSFNFGNPWESFSQMVDEPLAKLAKYAKPIYIFSFACAEGAGKPSWITDALSVQIPARQEIAGWVWFNENKEKNWLVWSSPASLAAFQTAISK